jgi:hypothetical protein
MAKVVGLVAFALTAADGARAGDECDEVRRLEGYARRNFAEIQGPVIARRLHFIYFKTSESFPEAADCSLYRHESKARVKLACHYNGPRSDASSLADLIGECLNVSVAWGEPEGTSESTATVKTADAEFTIVSDPDFEEYSLYIEGAR